MQLMIKCLIALNDKWLASPIISTVIVEFVANDGHILVLVSLAIGHALTKFVLEIGCSERVSLVWIEVIVLPCLFAIGDDLQLVSGSKIDFLSNTVLSLVSRDT